MGAEARGLKLVICSQQGQNVFKGDFAGAPSYCGIDHSLSTPRRVHVTPSKYETHRYDSPRTYQIRQLPAEGAAADRQFQIARLEPQRISNDDSLASVPYQT